MFPIVKTAEVVIAGMTICIGTVPNAVHMPFAAQDIYGVWHRGYTTQDAIEIAIAAPDLQDAMEFDAEGFV